MSSAPRRDEAQARFIRILESTTDLVMMTDRNLSTVYVNRAGREMLGWTTDDATMHVAIEEVFPAWACATLHIEGIPHAIEHGSWSGETAVQARDGREIPVLQVMLAHKGVDGEMEFFSTICRDISDRKQKELERIEWSNRYDAAVAASGQVVFDWDIDTGGIRWGGAVEKVTGYKSYELDGGMDQFRDLIVEAERQRFEVVIERIAVNREALEGEFEMTRKHGKIITVKISGQFFLDRSGQLGRMVGFFSDITAERMAEKAITAAHERLEQRVVERTAELERANQKMQDTARQQEVVARLGQLALAGIPLDDLCHEAVVAVRNALKIDCTSVNDYNPVTQEFDCRAHTGWPAGLDLFKTPGGNLSQSGYTLEVGHPVVSSNYEIESRFVPSEACRAAGIRCGITAGIQVGSTPLGVLGAFSKAKRIFGTEDINFLQGVANVISAAIERRNVEEAARRAQAEAEAANRAKNEFLSRMSHELRTPLNAILGFTQLLELEEHNERQAESIVHISRAGQNLLGLINEVLDIARLDSGRVQFHLDAIELGPFIAEVVALTQPLAERNKVSIRVAEITGAARVRSDRERIKQVFLNLVSNAVKYNREDGNVTVGAARDGSVWRLSVTDSGQGISADRIARLFVPFERPSEKDGVNTGGSGLGLALCQRLVKALDGKIGVVSTPGLGSTFWVELPVAPELDPGVEPVIEVVETAPLDPQVPVQPERKKHKLLYIEDDIANFHLIERVLEPQKHVQLISAIQGRLGFDLAREHQPSLILLDLNLPDISGEALFKNLRADPATRDIPVVFITGEAVGDLPGQLLAMGAAAVLGKPYRIQEFNELLGRFVGAE